MMMRLTILLILALVFVTTSTAWAQPKIDIVLKAETEVKQLIDGQEVTVRIPATEIDSDKVIIYTLICSNTGTAPATNVKVNDPIPTATRYVSNSVFGDGADITFSIDNGKTYKKPSLLSYKIKLADGSFEERVATPEEYTNVQWEINSIPAGGTISVGFRAVVR